MDKIRKLLESKNPDDNLMGLLLLKDNVKEPNKRSIAVKLMRTMSNSFSVFNYVRMELGEPILHYYWINKLDL